MIQLKTIILEMKYEYGCVMAYLPQKYATQMIEFGRHIITDDMLYFDPTEPDDYGREVEPHVTIKFGLTDSYPKEKMAEFLRGTKPFNIRITGMSIFQNPKFDVVKMNVESEELRRLRAVFDQVPNQDSYKEYHPHLTLAYVKSGMGTKFQNRSVGKFAQIPISTIVYSDRGDKSVYPLGENSTLTESIKSLKGTSVQRYKNLVGKRVGYQVYVHKKYAAEIIPAEPLKLASELLTRIKPEFRFNSVMWNMKTNEIRFDEAADFDAAREPHVGKYISVYPNGTIREGQSNSIWHHKWLWVKDDYEGFDVDEAKKWSIMWLSKLPQIAKGTDVSFGAQLKDVGLFESTQKSMDIIYGGIFSDGRIVAAKADGKRSGHSSDMGWNRWIYYGNIKQVVWWNYPPDEDDRQEVENYLTRRGHEVKRHDNLDWSRSATAAPTWGSETDKYPPYNEGSRIKLKELLMNEASQDEAAIDFLKKMVQSGPFRGKVYLAGGAVRDMIRGEVPKDLDVVVTDNGKNGGMLFATWLAKQMGNYKPKSNPVLFPKFGTAKVVLTGHHNGVDLDGFDVESVFARKEVYTPGSRKPEVFPGTIEDDAFRRDCTVNSMMLDLTTGRILDITGKGRSDIKSGTIRTTSNPDEIFGQDALRMFRAVRFATKYNWQLDPATIEGIKKNLDNLGNTSRERVRDELDKILQTGNPKRGFELLRDLGLLSHLAPEFQQMVGMTQNVHHNEDVFGHTLSVLQGTSPELVTRLIALFHDIGKVATRSETPTGVHFYGHEDVGAEVADRVMRDLKYPLELIQAVSMGVKNHMRLKQGGDDAVKLSDKALRRFKIELGDNLEKILDVIHADNTAHAGPSAMPNQIANVRKRLQNLSVTVKKPELPISGEDLKAMGIKQGPIFGKILSAITDKWFENPNITREEAIAIAKSMV
jgi:poly(A) polymerase